MHTFILHALGRGWRWTTLLVPVMLGVLLSTCASALPLTTNGTGTTRDNNQLSFPGTAPALRVPNFRSQGEIAPTVKVLASLPPTLIVQFPLFPSSIKNKFPQATGLVTVFQNPQANDFDVVTVDVQHMPPHAKFTVFFIEIAAKPFGHAEYVGDVITDQNGDGESNFHLITLVAFAADARHSDVTSQDQSGRASGIQLEHVGMWFDGVNAARQVLGDPKIPGTPFDGGHGPLHAGPQAMTDGQLLPVI